MSVKLLIIFQVVSILASINGSNFNFESVNSSRLHTEPFDNFQQEPNDPIHLNRNADHGDNVDKVEANILSETEIGVEIPNYFSDLSNNSVSNRTESHSSEFVANSSDSNYSDVNSIHSSVQSSDDLESQSEIASVAGSQASTQSDDMLAYHCPNLLIGFSAVSITLIVLFETIRQSNPSSTDEIK